MRRGAGVLMHLSSLPSPYGIGDLGPEAYRFADALAAAGVGFWQMLPLNPTNPENGDSPYFSASAFAGNPLLVSPDLLVKDGFLDKSDVSVLPEGPAGEVDYPAVRAYKTLLLDKAFEKRRTPRRGRPFERFHSEQEWWLDDFCLFLSLKRSLHEVPWSAWPPPLRDRSIDDVLAASRRFDGEMERSRFEQWLFFSQWFRLKRYCAQKNITIIGDLPIYVSLESADVWTSPHLFKIDRKKHPTGVSGVPPDYFSATGQLWNNPVYDWDEMRRHGFTWWEQRFRATFDRFDIVRIDHFRGLVQYWEVPAGETTAMNGSWQDVPTRPFFDAMTERLRPFPVIAEDLGTITPDVRAIMDLYQFPGMKVLQFAFGEDHPDHPYLPHTYGENCVAYTGTHDNMPLCAWLEHGARPDERERLFRYLGRDGGSEEVAWALIERLMQSKAALAVVPLQDLLCLGMESRMNDPGQTFGNWKWRCTSEQMAAVPWQRFSGLARSAGR
ncbi:MAG: 4-alpha-glucanotransferase [Chitinispirillaceae bacterium]|nr:4-alpha-glucanotransferase [Chitinispirillaceae bacterium]